MPQPPKPRTGHKVRGSTGALPVLISAPDTVGEVPNAPPLMATVPDEGPQVFVDSTPLRPPVRSPPTREMQGNMLLYTLHTKQYLDNKRMEKYVGEFENLFDRLQELGEDFTVPERLKVSLLLFSFKGHCFGNRISKLRERKEQDLSWHAVKTDLINEYMQLKTIEEEVREKGPKRKSKPKRFSLRKTNPETVYNCVQEKKGKS